MVCFNTAIVYLTIEPIRNLSFVFDQIYIGGIIQKAIVFSQGEKRIDGNCDCCQYEYKNIGTKQRGTESAHHDDGEIKNDGTDVNSKKNHNIHKASNKNNKNADAVWRTEITYRTLLLLRATATNVEFPSQQIPAYRIKELTGFEKEFVQPNYTFMKQHSIPQATALNSFRVPLKLVSACLIYTFELCIQRQMKSSFEST